jgi:uncharacterized membrane protein YraQ (UPF0718 family)
MTIRDTAGRQLGDPGSAENTDTAAPAPHDTLGPPAKKGYRPGSLEIFGAILLLAIVFRGPLESFLGHPVMQSWSTVFVAICVQATPFLVLGVVVSGAIAAFVPPRVFSRIMPSNAALAVPVAGICGAALPGCECGSVPISNRLIERGVRPSASLAFMLSAPAINPIVLIATAVAFTSTPSMVWARLVAGLLTAVFVGWIWERIGRPEWMKPRVPVSVDGQSGWRVFLSTILGDFTQAAGFLVIGAAAAATFKTIVPAHVMESIGSSLLLSIGLMAGLAFILALCSEADAFVAAAFSTIPVIGKLVFLTVGPAVDVKLFAMQAGVFGRKFAVRFAPLTFIVAVVVATTVGLLFWGWS